MPSFLNGYTRVMTAIGLLAVGALAGCTDQSAPLAPVPTNSNAFLTEELVGPPPDSMFNRWIVLFRNDVDDPIGLSQRLIGLHGGHPIHFYQKAVTGFAVANLRASSVDALRANPLVALVEESILVPEAAIQYLPLDSYSFQTSSLWSLDRIDVRQQSFNGEFRYDYTGSGVHIYIVDSGIRCGHTEFAGRIGNGVTRLANSWGASPCIDSRGHGTGVASSAGGTTYGIAKGAILHPVRVNDSNKDAYCDDIVAGLDWVVGNAIRPAVTNLSFGGVPSCFSVRDAIEGVVNAGITMVKSAGNEDYDAYQDRGNRAVGAIIVGASDYSDRRATFATGLASYGSTITLFAPGYSVRVAWSGHDSDSQIKFGSSFSAPYVAGAAATYLQQSPYANAYAVRDVIRNSATAGALSNLGAGSPNLLLNSLLRSVAIQGPDFITSDVEATYTWTASTTGGTPQSYLWEISISGGGYTTVSTAASYSRTIFPADSYNFVLRLTAVVDGESVTTTKSVTVSAPEPPPPCGPELIC